MTRGRLLLAVLVGLAVELLHLFHYEKLNMNMNGIIHASEGGEGVFGTSLEAAGDLPRIRGGQSNNKNDNVLVQQKSPVVKDTGKQPPLNQSPSTTSEEKTGADAELSENNAEQSVTPVDPEKKDDAAPIPREHSVRDISRDVAAYIAQRAGVDGQAAPKLAPKPVPLQQFDAAKFDYKQAAFPTDYTLPPPKVTDQSTVVITLSSRANFAQRIAIRESWAKGNDNVYFVIGGPDPRNQQDVDRNNPSSTSNLLMQEQKQHGDIIDSIHPDTYRSLPYKLHFAVRWVFNNAKNVEWIVKADDDQVVRVKRLQFFVLRNLNPSLPMVLGTIAVGGKPHRTGKWAEDPKYKEQEYPPWPFGSAGYVVSRRVAEYLAQKDDLYYYQGEDAGLGIWLNESPLQVTFLDSPELRKEEGCHDRLYVIGHDLDPQTIRDCFMQLGDHIPERKHIISFTAARKDQFPNLIRNPAL